MRFSLIAFFAAMSAVSAVGFSQEIKIPGFTAYLDPNANSARVNDDGVSGWSTADHLLWGGVLNPGQIKATLTVALPQGESAKLKMTIAGQDKEADVTGAANPVAVDFGEFAVKDAGYQRIELIGESKSGKTFGNILELTLSGPGAKDAFFNLKPRRNAASVHLNYVLPPSEEVVAFYNELTPKADPVATYYEACGFSRGYFGIQVNSKTERRVIFSVWDAGNESTDRRKVQKENLVALVAKGDGVEAASFGNEGTGGHSHLVYPWKTGETQKFLVTAKAEGDSTVYTGYFYFNDAKKWGLIASFRAPHDGKLLRNLYSFNEDFDGANGQLQRLCEFANQWVKTPDGKWAELTKAKFTHDATGGTDRRDFGAGVTKDGRFFLSNGGFIAIPMESRSLSRPGGGTQPTDLPAGVN